MELASKPKKLTQVSTPLNSVSFSYLGRYNSRPNCIYFGFRKYLQAHMLISPMSSYFLSRPF
jgi:hypothetical protein